MLGDTQTLSCFADFEVLKQIGKGSYGTVFRVRRKKDGEVYAMKCIPLSNMDRKTVESTLNEIRILCSVDHPYIVGYREAFLHKNDAELCIVMELVGGGDLASKIAECVKRKVRINEPTIWKYLLQTLLGLKALNELKIIHRDIKPANLFLTSDFETVKLGDLNVAKIARNDVARTQIGTPYYLAPEIWKNETYGPKCDIFSVGCLVYELAALRVPFDGNSMQELFKKISLGVVSRIPSEYSEDLYAIIKLCLTTNPRNRPSVDELLAHPVVKAKMSVLGLSPALDHRSNDALLETIKMEKKLNRLKIELPKRNKYRAHSASLIRCAVPASKRDLDLPVPSSSKPAPPEPPKTTEEKYNSDVSLKGRQDKPTIKLPPVKPSSKPCAVALPSKKAIPKEELPDRKPSDPGVRRASNQSPQVKRYNDYLEMLLEQNKVYQDKREAPGKPSQRSGSADPRKRAEHYEPYKERPVWWG